jgi:hypothetical protein
MKIELQGSVKSAGKVQFDRGLLLAEARLGEQRLAQASVDANGEYALELEVDALPEAVEMRVVPEGGGEEGWVMRKQISTARFEKDPKRPNVLTSSVPLYLPVERLKWILRWLSAYKVHGQVLVQYPSYFNPLPAARIDFYEVDPAIPLRPPFCRPAREDYLGSAFTNPNGEYTFSFKFGSLPFASTTIPVDSRPDIRAKIHVFIEGTWTLVYEAPLEAFDWNIGTDFRRDYVVPVGEMLLPPELGVKPSLGFQFRSIGLIPVDDDHLSGGYATTKTTDPVPGISHQPFCGTLRIFGLFATSAAVTTYAVEILRTDAKGVALSGETWQSLSDPLVNLKWLPDSHKWEAVTLGPTDGRYKNIDTEAEGSWHEHGLKFTWNTANRVDGYYRVRVTGYNAQNQVGATQELQLLRIDNSLPEAAIDILAPATSTCGMVTLGAAKKLTFQVTASSSQGHMLGYTLSGTRGRAGVAAGSAINASRPNAQSSWTGVVNASVDFQTAERTAAQQQECPTLAYNFCLVAEGSATNGYAAALSSRQVIRYVNLVVTG